jgi:hypothetical protein
MAAQRGRFRPEGKGHRGRRQTSSAADWRVMFCRISLESLPLVGTARPAGEGDVEGDVERGRQRHPRPQAVVCREPLPMSLHIADQQSAKTPCQRKLHDQGCPLRRQDGRRFLPPEELQIVPQPGRERPPTRPTKLAPGPFDGGRSRPGCLVGFHLQSPRDRVGTSRRDRASKCAALRRAKDDRVWTVKIAGHHAFDSGAVLGAVNALRCASTPPAAGPSGIDRACAQLGRQRLRDGRIDIGRLSLTS